MFWSCRAARGRKAEDRVASSVVRKIGIGENYEGRTRLTRSDISKFSGGTGPSSAHILWQTRKFHYGRRAAMMRHCWPLAILREERWTQHFAAVFGHNFVHLLRTGLVRLRV